MSTTVPGRLYELLPVLYRLRDADRGEPLRALLALVENEVEAIRQDIDALYDNWFIETCQDWVAPYIGDLLGAGSLHAVTAATLSERARVANTLAYRRRKGTLAMLEQLARDVTGWPARAVEFFQVLGTTQHLNHLRPANVRTPDLRDTDRLELLDTPFDGVAHAAGVRRIAARRGRHNIPNVGLFLWRLQSYFLEGVRARSVVDPPDGRFTMSPLGLDAPLFNRPQTETSISSLAGEENLPGPLRRRALYEDVEALRRARAEGRTQRPRFFGGSPVFAVQVEGEADPVPPDQVLICDLSDPPAPIADGWPRPPATKSYPGQQVGATVDLPIRVAVDPVLGRVAFPRGVAPAGLRVSFAYGFPGDLGGGPYDRAESASQALTGTVGWQIGVAADAEQIPGQIVNTLAQAVAAWNGQPAGTIGVIAVMDSATYAESLTADAQIMIPDGSQLLIVAAGWPQTDDPEVPGQKRRSPGRFTPEGLRPHLRGDLSVRGAGGSERPGLMAIDGLLVEGRVTVLAGDLGTLRLAHCTLVPGRGGVRVNPSTGAGAQNEHLTVTIDHSICGGIELPEVVPRVEVVDSVLNGGDREAISAPGSAADLQRSTVLGGVTVQTLAATDCLFAGRVAAARRQTGCVRFSFLPPGSATPRRYRCQPEAAIQGASGPAEQALALARVIPSFTSVRFGGPGYARLGLHAPEEIRTGAENGAEMGAWNGLRQAQREANLLASLEEYLRFGLEAGIFFVT